MAALETLVKVVMALAVVVYVGYPLLRERWVEEETEMPEEMSDLYHRKEATYSALKELEFDYRTGKLSESDFRELEDRYRADGSEILEAIEGAGRGGAGVRESATIKRGSGAAVRESASAPVVPAAGLCGSCGAVNAESAKFCAACGEALGLQRASKRGEQSDSSVCAGCGEPLKSGAKFCGSCGVKVDS